jgi:hypothetical protein
VRTAVAPQEALTAVSDLSDCPLRLNAMAAPWEVHRAAQGRLQTDSEIVSSRPRSGRPFIFISFRKAATGTSVTLAASCGAPVP